MHWKKCCIEHVELSRQLCEGCPHLSFLTAVCKFGKPKSVEKSILHRLNMLRNLKQEMLFVLLPVFALNSAAESSALFTTEMIFG